MIRIQWAKSVMENEEGMNHLWLRLPADPHIRTMDITVELPPGMFRSPNLNGYPEDTSGVARVNRGGPELDLLYEIYTVQAVPCGEADLLIRLRCIDIDGKSREYMRQAKLLLSADPCLVPEIDEEVAERVKSLAAPLDESSPLSENGSDAWQVVVPRVDASGELSEWERKYRVDG
ncbi:MULTISPECIES: hypothetical protein [Paenibacillus]|uniref:hypothetical protein n=1 Tax=Paenibacillus TaxID=44249 RepID=UPI0022B88F80|nr:hypothetical protein [Paenibacillus caseinilyticus]MCZ8521177.1 hypothetical protein [Paenibacillus caseinilyticus]